MFIGRPEIKYAETAPVLIQQVRAAMDDACDMAYSFDFAFSGAGGISGQVK
jgi:hypothetical protein